MLQLLWMCVAYPTSLSGTSPHSSGIWVPSPKVGPSSPSPSRLSLQLPLLWAAQFFPSPRLKLHLVFTSSSSARPSPNIKSVLHNRSFALATWQCPAWPVLSFWDLTWCRRCRQALPWHSSPPNSSEHKAYQLKEQVRKFTLGLKKSQWLLILPIYHSSRKLQGEGIQGQPSLTPTGPWTSLCSLQSLCCSQKCPHWHSLHFWASCLQWLLCFHLSKVVLFRLPAWPSYDRPSETSWPSAIRKSSPTPDSMCHLLHSSQYIVHCLE